MELGYLLLAKLCENAISEQNLICELLPHQTIRLWLCSTFFTAEYGTCTIMEITRSFFGTLSN